MNPPSVVPVAVVTQATNIKSFAEVVGGSSSPSILHKSPDTHRGEPALFFSDEDIASLSFPFRFALSSLMGVLRYRKLGLLLKLLV